MGIFDFFGGGNKNLTKGKDGKTYYGKGTKGGLAPNKPSFENGSDTTLPKLPKLSKKEKELQRFAEIREAEEAARIQRKEAEKAERLLAVPDPVYSEEDVKKFHSWAEKGITPAWRKCTECNYNRIVLWNNNRFLVTDNEYHTGRFVLKCERCQRLTDSKVSEGELPGNPAFEVNTEANEEMWLQRKEQQRRQEAEWAAVEEKKKIAKAKKREEKEEEKLQESYRATSSWQTD